MLTWRGNNICLGLVSLASNEFGCNNFEPFRTRLYRFRDTIPFCSDPLLLTKFLYTTYSVADTMLHSGKNLNLFFSYNLWAPSTLPCCSRTDVHVHFMGGSCSGVSGRVAGLQLFRLVDPSSRSCTGLRNNLVTSTYLSLKCVQWLSGCFCHLKERGGWRREAL